MVSKIIKYGIYIFISVLVILFLIFIGPSLWRRWVAYPGMEKERAALWEKHKIPKQYIRMPSYKGVMHAHNYWSHDSGGTLEEILDAAKAAQLDFIFFSDHAHNRLDTFPRSYHGVFDGIIMESGTESSTGLMVNPFDSVVLDWGKPEDTLIHEIVANGGLVTYVHTEKHHRWLNPDYQAMEIYNIHTDLLDESDLLPIYLNFIFGGKKFRHWEFREIFDEQQGILNTWDLVNQAKKVTGIGGADAHNNNSFKARYLKDGKVEWVGPNADILSVREPGFLEALLLGNPDKYGWSFKFEMDPYFNSFSFVNNHVFCDTFTSENIKENIIKGHVFVAFETLGDASGFQFFVTNKNHEISGILGDSVCVEDAGELHIVSPLPIKYRLYKNGEEIKREKDVYEASYKIDGPGVYRVMCKLKYNNKWLTWIYSNPIFIYKKSLETHELKGIEKEI